MITARVQPKEEYKKQKQVSHKPSNGIKKVLIRRMTAVWMIGLCLIVALIFTLNNQKNIMSDQKAQQKEKNNELKELSKESSELKKKIRLLNDDQYIADLARKDFFFSKKGEIIFSLPE